MQSMLGQAFSHYRIQEKLGEGGMGVVYRAEDSLLNRPVAVKALPAGATSDPERRQRFLHEARTASSLNHPNIVTIHDICQFEGADLIVMEYVPGRTLSEVIGNKGLRFDEAVKVALQIADALAAAHRAGIVHRDLKPGNVVISDQGRVKVLDFGLAKLMSGISRDRVDKTETVVLGEPRTMDGVLMGTIAYMSPEQAEGKPVDSRSDVFAFGAVLYEMVTGRKAFQGDSTASTLAAILREQPKPATLIAGHATGEFEKIIQRCLRKDPARRYQCMDDVKLALEEVKEASESLPAAAPTLQRARIPSWKLATAGALLMVVAAVAGWWARHSSVAAGSPAGPVLTQVTFDVGLSGDPALSPDGRMLAYTSDRSGDDHLDIWVQQVAGGEPLRLTRDAGDDSQPAFSPDGTTIAYRSERDGGALYSVPTLGGQPRFLARQGRFPRYSPDGKLIAFWIGNPTGSVGTPGASRLFVIPSGGGEPRQVATQFQAAFPAEWVDSTHLMFGGLMAKDGDTLRNVWVLPINGGEAIPTGLTPVLEKQGVQSNIFLPPRRRDERRFIWPLFQANTFDLWEVTLSPGNWQFDGALRRLTAGTVHHVQPSVAGNALMFTAGSERYEIWSTGLDVNQGRTSGELKQLTSIGYAVMPELSANGRRLVYLAARGREIRLYVRNIDDGKEMLLAGPAELHKAVISFDGAKVAYRERHEGKWLTYSMPAEGGIRERICDDCGQLLQWSRDGMQLIHTFQNPTTIRVLDTRTGAKSVIVRHKQNSLWQGQISPDGRWIAFLAAQPDQNKCVFVAPFRPESSESEWIPITGFTGENDKPRWSPDGNLLYFTSDRDGSRCIWAQRLNPATKRPAGEPFGVFHSHGARRSLGRIGIGSLEISIAAGRLAFVMGEESANIWTAKLE
jgi:eukaryotic-like serine/threonine-protein kinase